MIVEVLIMPIINPWKILFLMQLTGAFTFFLLGSVSYGNNVEDNEYVEEYQPVKETIEHIVMPGQVIASHAKYENDCKLCHTRFRKGFQVSLCLKCHKKVAKDVQGAVGFHGRSNVARVNACKNCHTEHLGRRADVVRLNRDFFNHKETDFPLEINHVKVPCGSCHKPKIKYRDTPKECINCHKSTDPHYGRLGEKCLDCHKDLTWRKFTYDHNKTKFPLKEKHVKVACAACHPAQRWQKTPLDCYSCHKINDFHRGNNGRKCEMCHEPTEWKKHIYNHDKTKFPLRDRHSKLRCSQCHDGQLIREKKLGPKCYRCHEHDDNHQGVFGEKCDLCHTSKGWKKSKHDHGKGKFPLVGKHQKVKCSKCHLKPLTAEYKPGMACYDCHRLDEKHQGVFGKKCDKCHTPEEWKKNKHDHSKGKFPLVGNHAKVKCHRCHKTPVDKQKPSGKCFDCHKDDDAHNGQQKKVCSKCHNPKGWTEEVFFDHDITPFPLIGQHGIVACEECHLGNAFKDTKKECFPCHKDRDEHKQYFGQKCGLCHNPNGWNLWQFDHSKRTKFKLSGAHKELPCGQCHTRPVKENKEIMTRKTCHSCHMEDDVHRGTFGKPCERCHTPDSFQQIILLK